MSNSVVDQIVDRFIVCAKLAFTFCVVVALFLGMAYTARVEDELRAATRDSAEADEMSKKMPRIAWPEQDPVEEKQIAATAPIAVR